MRYVFASILTVILAALPFVVASQELDALDAQTRAFIRDEGLAVAVVENCKDPRFEMSENHQTRFEALIVTLLADGFTKEQIEASLSEQAQTVRDGGAAEYLTQNGVVPGDLDSLCRFAQVQIEKGDTFGPILSEQ